MHLVSESKPHRYRSFVRRAGKISCARKTAWRIQWPQYGLELTDSPLQLDTVFGRRAACYLEIGFGFGHSLAALAKQYPEHNYIGVETHRAGICALCSNIITNNLNNIRIYDADVIDVLNLALPDNSLDGGLIFFPDPWPKRKHHPRRLIQPDFLKLLARKIKSGGIVHTSTDWQDYAIHMLNVFSNAHEFQNRIIGLGHEFAARSFARPVITKFEQRALNAGRPIYDLQFVRV